MFYVHGMNFKLVDDWLDLANLEKFLDVVWEEIGDTNELDEAFLHVLLKSFP